MIQLKMHTLLHVLLMSWMTLCQTQNAEVLLILRIPADDSNIYETLVIEHKEPRVYGGKIQAFAEPDEVEVIGSETTPWSDDRALSVIAFPNEDLAKQWYSSAEGDIDQIWTNDADILLQKMDAELPGQDKTALLLMPTMIHNTTAFFNTYTGMADEIFEENGGANGAMGDATNQWQRLKGLWPTADDKLYLQVAFFTSVAAATTFWSSDDFAEALAYQKTVSEQDVYTCQRSVDLQGEDYGVYALVRLSADRVDNYVASVLGEKANRSHPGLVQVMAKNASEVVTLAGTAWASGKALSVIHFSSQPAAKQWYSLALQDDHQPWTDQADVLLQPLTEELPSSEMKAMILSVSRLSDEDDFFTNYMPELTQLFQSDKYGGTGGATGEATNRWIALAGSWPQGGAFIQILHTSSVEKASEFWTSDDYANGPEKLKDQSVTSMNIYATARQRDLINVKEPTGSNATTHSGHVAAILAGLALIFWATRSI